MGAPGTCGPVPAADAQDVLVRVKGAPYESSEADVRAFFAGYAAEPRAVHLLTAASWGQGQGGRRRNNNHLGCWHLAANCHQPPLLAAPSTVVNAMLAAFTFS
jgi:hypothetical protein